MTLLVRSFRLLLIVALLVGCAAAQTYQTSGKCNDVSSPFSCTITLNVTAGYDIWVGIGTQNGTGVTSSVSSTNISSGNWSVFAGPNTSGAANTTTWLYHAVAPTTTATEVITVTVSDGTVANNLEAAAAAYSGGMAVLDQNAISTVTTAQTSWTTANTSTTTIATELMVGFCMGTGSTSSFTPTNSFTMRQQTTSSPAFIIMDKNLSSTGAYAATLTSGTSRSYNCLTATAYAAVVADPTFSPVAGGYTAAQTVTISTITSGSTICYTTDGSTPAASTPGTCSAGTTYSGPVSVNVSETLKAIGTKVAYTNSAVVSAAYTLTAVAPTCSIYPYSGHYPQVVLSSTSPSPTFLYCVDTNDTCTPASSYSVPVQISVTGYIRALTQVSGWSNSSVSSCAYTIAPPITQITGKTRISGKTRIQ